MASLTTDTSLTQQATALAKECGLRLMTPASVTIEVLEQILLDQLEKVKALRESHKSAGETKVEVAVVEKANVCQDWAIRKSCRYCVLPICHSGLCHVGETYDTVAQMAWSKMEKQFPIHWDRGIQNLKYNTEKSTEEKRVYSFEYHWTGGLVLFFLFFLFFVGYITPFLTLAIKRFFFFFFQRQTKKTHHFVHLLHGIRVRMECHLIQFVLRNVTLR